MFYHFEMRGIYIACCYDSNQPTSKGSPLRIFKKNPLPKFPLLLECVSEKDKQKIRATEIKVMIAKAMFARSFL